MAEEIIKNKVPHMTVEVTTKDGTSLGTFTGGSALSIKQFIEGRYTGFIRIPDPSEEGKFINVNSECICVVTEELTWTEEDLPTGWETWGCCNDGSVPVTGLTVAPTTISGSVGGTTQITPTVTPADATNKAVTYTSANPAIATVSASGLVTNVANGSTQIIVSTVDGGIVAVIPVSISNPT